MINRVFRKLFGNKQQSDINYSDTALRPGHKIGNYQIHSAIGSGGFGVVYRAENVQVNREVAVKIYKVQDQNAFIAFRQGANLLAQLNHPNIIKLYDFFTTDSHAVMVMELLSADETLGKYTGSYCRDDSLDKFLQIFQDILSAMRYCHQSKFRDIDGSPKNGIYHGDIKPDNIFLDKGVVKITDFMIPDLERHLQTRTSANEMFPRSITSAYGTVDYMSDEQASGVVNEQTDIYSIGLTVYELLTGMHPKRRETTLRKKYQPGVTLFKPPSVYCSNTPDWLDTIVMKCCAIDSEERYEHIYEIERDIKDGLATQTRIPKGNHSAKKVLVVFANPKGTDFLRLSTEDRVIHECVRLSRNRDNIHLKTLHAATIHDIRRSLLEEQYQIIHFSGHGTGTGLAMENEFGEPQVIPPEALAEFLSAYSPPIECVILNACYTNLQGQLLALGVPYTIATEGPISDSGAQEFTRGFYDAIGAGKNIEFAYQEGCRTIKLTGHADADIPLLLT